MGSELLDLVSEQDEIIRTAERDDIYADPRYLEEGLTPDGLCIRAINAFICRSDGKIWIPRRLPTKKIFPNALDMSVGGHVDSGESYEEAFLRETAEELNLHLTPDMYREIGYFNPWQHGVHAYQKVYEIILEEAPKYNPDDFNEYFWLSPEEILTRVSDGEKVKGDLPLLVKLIYSLE